MDEDRATIGHDHDGEVFYLSPALDPAYVEGCLERIGEDDPDEEDLLRGIWEDETQRDFVLETSQGRGGVQAWRPSA